MAVRHLHHLHYQTDSFTRAVFHSEVKTWFFGKSCPPETVFFPTGLIPRIIGPFIVFILLNGWIFLDGVLATPALCRFSNAIKIFASFISSTERKVVL